MGGPIPGAVGDPLPAPPLTENDWASIGPGRRLAYLGQDMVLDWAPATGDFRVWRFDRAAINASDPFPAPALCEGKWSTIGSGDQVIYVGDERVLVWNPGSGRFRIWLIDRAATGNADPLPGNPQTEGVWTTLGINHELIPLGGQRILDWDKQSQTFRTWHHDPSAVGAADPFPGPPVAQGALTSVPTDHRLIAVGKDRVVDWSPSTGGYRVWRYERNATGSAFFGDPEVVGAWETIRSGHELVYLDGDRVLDWQPSNGHYRVWRFDRNVTTLRRATVRVHLRILFNPVFPTIDQQVASLKAVYASYGIDVVVVSRRDVATAGTDLVRFLFLNIDECKRSLPPTPEQIDLFNHFREGVEAGELVVYFVQQTFRDVNGCARFPPGKPGAVIAGGLSVSEWTLAHEIGHVLGLDHVDESANASLMFSRAGAIRDLPPDLSTVEIDSILASDLVTR